MFPVSCLDASPFLRNSVERTLPLLNFPPPGCTGLGSWSRAGNTALSPEGEFLGIFLAFISIWKERWGRERMNVGILLGSLSWDSLFDEELNCCNWLMAPKGSRILVGMLLQAAMVVLSVVCSCVSTNRERERMSISVPIKPSFEMKEAFNMWIFTPFFYQECRTTFNNCLTTTVNRKDLCGSDWVLHVSVWAAQNVQWMGEKMLWVCQCSFTASFLHSPVPSWPRAVALGVKISWWSLISVTPFRVEEHKLPILP